MIEDISVTHDVMTEKQDNNCDICNNKIKTTEYLTVSDTKMNVIPSDIGNQDRRKYYAVCLDCVEKIRDLLIYNYGFDGRLIHFFKGLKESNDEK